MSEHGERTADTAAARRDGRTDPATEAFVAHRNLLFTVAYEMLGSAADAEDVLQETWLRWAGVDLDTVRDQRAYLVRITTRQALSRLRTLGRRKESYVGPWLPEPLLTAPDVAEDVELADSVSMAMLLVLETLTPTERAVFVLREVFDLGYDEIAEAVDKSPAAVRQIAHRARAHVAARRPRGVVSPAETRDALEAFQRAVETGDLQSLLDILAPDVVLLGDGGGVKQAVLRPIVGADKVARLLAAGLGRIAATVSLRAGTGQRLPGADRPARRRDRHRRGGAHRRRPHHRALRRPQPREAVAHGAGDRPAPLSPGPSSSKLADDLGRSLIRDPVLVQPLQAHSVQNPTAAPLPRRRSGSANATTHRIARSRGSWGHRARQLWAGPASHRRSAPRSLPIFSQKVLRCRTVSPCHGAVLRILSNLVR